ncbi:hypothetical protein [Microvirga yunnanensis]|uniref:hypothetical protein n=1 Tax=Microvirga yunnanensis TaxID=2953740 RepID=UPI0021CA6F74|nr:hypothetical protein [Microvirga sp. HBU65207]
MKSIYPICCQTQNVRGLQHRPGRATAMVTLHVITGLVSGDPDTVRRGALPIGMAGTRPAMT